MALNIGTLVGYLQLDDTNFERKADTADRKMRALQLHLEALGRENPKISVEVATQTAALDELRARMTALKAQAAEGVDVRADAVQALIELDRVQAKVRELHGKTITIDADTAPAERKLHALNGLWTTILGLGPTLVPITGGAALGISAIGSAAISAAGAVGVLKAAFAGMGSAISAYGSYRSAMDKATGLRRAALQQAATPTQRQAAQQAYQKSVTAANATLSASTYGQLGPEGQRFARFAGRQLAPGGAVFRLRSAAQESVLPGVMEGARAAMPALPTILPTVRSIGNAVGGEVAAAGKALNDPFWQHFFTWLGHEAPREIKLFGSIFGNTIEGILRYLERFAPDGDKMLHWVDEAAKRFNQWTAGKGFSSFMAGLHQDGEAVARVLKPLVKLLPGLISGFNSTGVDELSTVGLILTGISKLPTGVIQFLAATLPIIVLALKGMQLAGTVSAGLKLLWASFMALIPVSQAEAAAQAEVDAAMDANPIGLVVVALAALAAGLIYAYHHSATFRNIVNAAFHAVSVAAGFAFDFIKKHWALLLILLGGPIGPVVVLIVKNFGRIVDAIKVLGKWGVWLWNNVFEPVTRLIVKGIAGVLSVWAGMIGALSKVPGFHWLGGLAGALQDASSKANSLADAINKIPPHKNSTISINVVRTVHGVVHSTGGHVAAEPGVQRHAAGGWAFGAGSATSDSIRAALSNGEFVENAVSAAANRPLVEAINRAHGPLATSQAALLAGGSQRRMSLAQPSPIYLVLDDGTKLRAHIEGVADAVAHADRRYLSGVGGMR